MLTSHLPIVYPLLVGGFAKPSQSDRITFDDLFLLFAHCCVCDISILFIVDSGACGEVRLAFDQVTHKPYAIKIISKRKFSVGVRVLYSFHIHLLA